MFTNRMDAGRKLAQELLPFKDQNVVVLAIPRGGLPLGAIVAETLGAPLDVVLSKKIGHPHNREYAIGAVSLDNIIITNSVGITKNYIEEERVAIRQKLKQRHQQYFKNRSPQDLKNKTVLIVDDGIATGNTILITVKLVHRQGAKKIIVAIPVAPTSAIQKLKKSRLVDDIICLETPYNFRAVGQFYSEFLQVSDEEAIGLLEKSNP